MNPTVLLIGTNHLVALHLPALKLVAASRISATAHEPRSEHSLGTDKTVHSLISHARRVRGTHTYSGEDYDTSVFEHIFLTLHIHGQYHVLGKR